MDTLLENVQWKSKEPLVVLKLRTILERALRKFVHLNVVHSKADQKLYVRLWVGTLSGNSHDPWYIDPYGPPTTTHVFDSANITPEDVAAVLLTQLRMGVE